jgi:hypothetical protein
MFHVGRLATIANISHRTESSSIDASWQEAALYVVTEEHSPPPIVDAELK